MDGTLFAAKWVALTMAKITIKFLAAHIEDDQVELFIKKIDEVLKRFAGNAYNFRYDVEDLHFDSDTERLKHP